MTDTEQIEATYREVQAAFCAAVEEVDGEEKFAADDWVRPGGGGGTTRILSGLGPIEKAAVNFSSVAGETPAALSERMAVDGSRFFATGVSIIVHPRNPHVPTFHANIRYFETDTGQAWFGGGADLTPCYVYEPDAARFHRTLKETCDRHAVADYDAWKRACDEYFYLPHRGEARGVGGIFFDHLTEPLDEIWAYQREFGLGLTGLYLPIVEARRDEQYGEQERTWQELRRGRYAEFNLIWDRGTRFGLETSGRTESILASLPPRARWVYGYEPSPGSREAELLELVRGPPRRWA